MSKSSAGHREPRAGFVSENIFTALGGGLVQIGGTETLISEFALSETGSVHEAGGSSLTTEFLGNTIPPAGQSFDSNVIFYPMVDVLPEQFISEFTGNYAANRDIIGLTWQFGGNTPPEGFGTGSGGGHTVHPAYRHTQSVASTIWLIQHDLGLQPVDVTVYVDNIEVDYQVTLVSTNLARVDLNQAATGTALVLG